ncbi:MAG: MoaD/ThiS family protein [Planctomycetota bacterium]
MTSKIDAKIEVKVFGPQAESIGEQVMEISVPQLPVSSEDVLAAIPNHYPRLSDSMRVSRLAINHAFARPGQMIRAEDEVALIGMISGG